MIKYLLIFGLIFLIGCSDTQEVKRPLKSTYVPPTTTYKGQFRKGYVIWNNHNPVYLWVGVIKTHSYLKQVLHVSTLILS